MSESIPASPYGAFIAQVRRLSWRTRVARMARGASVGLFYATLPAILVAALDGTLRFPFSVSLFAAAAVGIGLVAGAAAGLLRRVDARGMLIQADQLLGSHELAGTAYELAAAGAEGPFTNVVIDDASRLLSARTAREALGNRRSKLLPALPVVIAVLALALLLPFDLRPLFTARGGRTAELVDLGRDLQSYGKKLLDASGSDAARGLALSQQLTQLGKDLADRTLSEDDAMDRITEMEGMVSREYDLRMQEALSAGTPAPTGTGGAEAQGSGSGGMSSQSNGTSQPNGQPQPGERSGQSGGAGNNALQDLSDARNRLRDARTRIANGSGSPPPGSASAAPSGSGDATPGSGNLGGSTLNGPDEQGLEQGAGQSDTGSQGDTEGATAAGQAPGTTPSERLFGDTKPIQQGSHQAPLKESVPSGEGDSTRMLVEALPDANGAQGSDQAVVNDYARQAESALARDEVPLKLRQYVKDYFTVIGMSRDGTAQ